MFLDKTKKNMPDNEKNICNLLYRISGGVQLLQVTIFDSASAVPQHIYPKYSETFTHRECNWK